MLINNWPSLDSHESWCHAVPAPFTDFCQYIYRITHRLQQQHFKCIKFHIKLDISSSESEYLFKKVEVIRMFYSYYINNSYDLHLFGVKVVRYVAWEGNHFSFIACLSRKFTSGNSSYHARCLLSVCLLQNQNIIDKTDLCNSFCCNSRFHSALWHTQRDRQLIRSI